MRVRRALGARKASVFGAVVLSLLLALTAVSACVPGRGELRGDLQELIEEFISAIPGRDGGEYRPPTAQERDSLAAAVRAAREDDEGAASALLDPLAFELVRFRDVVTDRRLLVLRERRNGDGSSRQGWGLYVLDPGARSALIVEVPHPVADAGSEDLGVAAFRAGSAAALLVAGAHRAATPDADVAHEPDSAFETVHASLVHPGRIVLQLHGFDGDDHPRRYGDAVVADGEEHAAGQEPSAATAAVAGALSGDGFDVCLHPVGRCSGLAATTNVQGWSTRRLGGSFIHLEVEAGVRAEPQRWRRLVATAVTALQRCEPATNTRTGGFPARCFG